MAFQAQWNRMREIIEVSESFLLTSHLFPEADSIGSEVALALHLRQLGKEVVIVNDTPPLDRYSFLTRLHPVGSMEDLGPHPDPDRFDIAFTLDVSTWDYTGEVGDWLRRAGTSVVAIDHHHSQERFGVLDVIMEEAASAGEVLYHYFRAIGARITPPMAEALYASILFDTHGFRLSNTKNETLRVATELLDLGADHRHVSAQLFERESWARIHLLRLALGTLQRECDGRLVWLTISEDLFRLADAEFVDGDGILDFLLGLHGVEVCAMFRQLGTEGIKATFRSKGKQDVGALAEELGGGGRSTASGALLRTSMHDAIRAVLPRVYAVLGARDPIPVETSLSSPWVS
ncbi:MAG: DHH family phosphoesterase [Candidatus Eisenbacteria bacterium]